MCHHTQICACEICYLWLHSHVVLEMWVFSQIPEVEFQVVSSLQVLMLVLQLFFLAAVMTAHFHFPYHRSYQVWQPDLDRIYSNYRSPDQWEVGCWPTVTTEKHRNRIDMMQVLGNDTKSTTNLFKFTKFKFTHKSHSNNITAFFRIRNIVNYF